MLHCNINFGKTDFDHARYIRNQVFVQEQGFCQEFDDIDAIAWHAVLYDGDTPVGTGRAFHKPEDPAGVYTIGRIAVLPAWRGAGCGRQIMLALEKHLRAQKAVEVRLSAQVQARGFYEALGYIAYGQPYLDEHCPHLAMKKTF